MRKERERLRTKVKSIALEMSSAIAKSGINLATAVGTEQDFAILNNQTEMKVQQHLEDTTQTAPVCAETQNILAKVEAQTLARS